MRYIWVVVAMLSMVVAGQLGHVPSGGAVLKAQGNPIPMSEESVAAGRAVYVRFCASCHGRGGEGDGAGAFGDVPPANLVDDEWDHGGSDAEINKTIREGVPPDYNMEEWAGRVSDDDIWNIVNYLRDLADR